MRSRLELRYLSIFGLALLISGGALWLAMQKHSVGLLSVFVNHCTNLTAFLMSQRVVLGWGLMGVSTSLCVVFVGKLILSGIKTHRRKTLLFTHRVKKLSPLLQQLAHKHRVDPNQILLTSHTRPLAFTMGFMKPTLVFSQGLLRQLTPSELTAVFLHETYHLRRRHGLVFVLCDAISTALHFIAPALQDILRHMRLQLELAADQFAIMHQGTARPLHFALAKLRNSSTDKYALGFASASEIRLNFNQTHPAPPLRVGKWKLLVSFLIMTCLWYLTFTPAHGVSASNVTSQRTISQCPSPLQSVESPKFSPAEH